MIKRLIYPITAIFLMLILVDSCTSVKKDLILPEGCSDTLNITYSVTVVNILQGSCYTCHTGVNSSSGYDLTDYPTLKKFALNGILLANITHSGAPGSHPMPTPPLPKLDTCEIYKIQLWVEAGAPEN
jgi:hypothetical protein